MNSAVIFQIQSFIIFCILTFGLMNRRNKQIHTKSMFIAIVWDIILILQIELNRGAIAKASKAITNPFILNFHVAMAITCVVGYLFMMYSGRLLNIGEQKMRQLHKKVGLTTYLLRLITLVTSFFAVIPKN